MKQHCPCPIVLLSALRRFLLASACALGIAQGGLLQAQIFNNWTTLVSGSWEDPAKWSLGIRPASDQSVAITGAGYKAVDVSSSTAASYSNSMTVHDLTVSAPPNALSTLLLNYSGLNLPLRVLNSCTIGSNGSLENYYSSFQVDGANSGRLVLNGGGHFIQEGGLTVVTPTIELEQGAINATNATMNLGTLNLGSNFQGTPGNFYQSGGTVLTAGLRIDIGNYTLNGGTLYVLDHTILYAFPAHFDQLGGTNYGDVDVRGGYYHFYDGLIHGNNFAFTGFGNFFQHGGTAEFATMHINGGQGGPNYQLEAGSLKCGNLDITGLFRQYGGTLLLTNALQMNTGIYDLVGGTVLTPSMVLSNAAAFNYYFGTVQVAGNVDLHKTSMQFQGGSFSSANLGISEGSAFGQPSGSNDVREVLSISGLYFMNGGALSIGGMYLRGTLTLAASGGNPPPKFVNKGLINFGGTLNVSTSQDSMGQLGLTTNGTINLGGSTLIVRFNESAALNWAPNARLTITGWDGSYSGGGARQLYFGTSAGGLTTAQLAQVRFRNPEGSPPGDYPSRILSTGELVPSIESFVNSWISSTSGRWEVETNWSLGVRPAVDQSIAIMNEGYKAVEISSSTAAGFPETMVVSNLWLWSPPTNGLNALLLNYAGLNVPLRILNALTINTNGSLRNLYSSLQVDGASGASMIITNGGEFIQEGGLTVVTPTVELDGSLNATNATMNLGRLNLGDTYSTQRGTVNQSGGTLLTIALQIESGKYSLLTNGILYALGGTYLLSPLASFFQDSSTNYGDVVADVQSQYEMAGGLLQGTNLQVRDTARFIQRDGTVKAENLVVEGPVYDFPLWFNYEMHTGILYCSNLNITRFGSFLQGAGSLVVSNRLDLFDPSGYGPTFELRGGKALMPSLVVSNGASYSQSGGTNLISGNVVVENARLDLSGGLFSSSTLGVGTGSVLFQAGGTNTVAEVLSVATNGTINVQGGLLTVGGIYTRGNFYVGYLSGLIENPGVINFGGNLFISASQPTMGRLGLSANGEIILSGTAPLVLRFGDSSSLSWNPNALLRVSYWEGSYSGGGARQVYFGTSAGGLTTAQLAQIRFRNPAGSAPGDYTARILPTGEVVPVVPTLQFSRSATLLILSWDPGYALLSATNVAGPYDLVPGATSPYSIDLSTSPQAFFRLQGSN